MKAISYLLATGFWLTVFIRFILFRIKEVLAEKGKLESRWNLAMDSWLNILKTIQRVCLIMLVLSVFVTE